MRIFLEMRIFKSADAASAYNVPVIVCALSRHVNIKAKLNLIIARRWKHVVPSIQFYFSIWNYYWIFEVNSKASDHKK